MKDKIEEILSDEYQEKLRKGLEEYFESTKEEREQLEKEVIENKNECTFTLIDVKEWNEFVEKNKDPYGKAILIFANRWATYMEEAITNGFNSLTDKQIEDLSYKASDEVGGITGFMYGAGVATLKNTWKYGKELNKWHNKQYGKEDTEGTINPAVITIGG